MGNFTIILTDKRLKPLVKIDLLFIALYYAKLTQIDAHKFSNKNLNCTFHSFEKAFDESFIFCLHDTTWLAV